MLVVIASVAFLGCGEDRLNRSEYSERLSNLGDRADDNFGLFEAKSGQQVQASVRKMRDNQLSSAGRLEQMSPPEDAEESHELLIEGERRLASDLDRLLPGLERSRIGPLIVSQTVEQSPGRRKLEQAVRELSRRGYLEPQNERRRRGQ